jgi:hypothetical protein
VNPEPVKPDGQRGDDFAGEEAGQGMIGSVHMSCVNILG